MKLQACLLLQLASKQLHQPACEGSLRLGNAVGTLSFETSSCFMHKLLMMEVVPLVQAKAPRVKSYAMPSNAEAHLCTFRLPSCTLASFTSHVNSLVSQQHKQWCLAGWIFTNASSSLSASLASQLGESYLTFFTSCKTKLKLLLQPPQAD